jgi:hypothetical protein
MGNKNNKKKVEKTPIKPVITSANYSPAPNLLVNIPPQPQVNKSYILHDPPLPAVLPLTIFEFNERRNMPQMPLNFDI